MGLPKVLPAFSTPGRRTAAIKRLVQGISFRAVCTGLLGGLAACTGDGAGPSTTEPLPPPLTPPPPPPVTGTVRVAAHTSGLGLDPDGYRVRLSFGKPRSLSINGAVHFVDVAPGQHEVQLYGLADNCTLAPNIFQVTVEAGDTSTVNVGVSCRIGLRDRIAFISEVYGMPQLLAMYPDGTGRYRLTVDQRSYSAPAIFPGGSALVVGSDRDGGRRLFRFEVATGTITPLPHVGVMELQPAISPDGTQIAFEVVSADQASRIWVMGANGENPTALTTGPVSEPSDVAPAWSPDGQWIVFSRTGALYRIRPDGTMLTPMPCSPAPCNHPAWSPDGGSLAYTGLSDSGDGTGDNYDVMNVGSGAVRQLTTLPDQESMPRWSPDGSSLAYQRVVNGHMQLFRMQADGSGAINLTNLPVSEGRPAWRPGPRGRELQRLVGGTPATVPVPPSFGRGYHPGLRHSEGNQLFDHTDAFLAQLESW
jgi:hypothetical protein